jgi:hypothetical protein
MTKDEARALVREKVDELKAARKRRDDARSNEDWFAANTEVERHRIRLEQAVNDMLEVAE